MNLSTAFLFSALAIAGPGDPNPIKATSDELLVKHCLVSMIDHVRLSPNDAGPLTEILVDQGAVVAKGDTLGQLDDADSQIKLEAAEGELRVAEEQAKSDVNVRAAVKMADVAKAEWDQANAINRRSPGAVSETEVRRLKLTYERGVLQGEVAELELSVAKLTVAAKAAAVKAAKNEIRRRKIVAPIDAIVDHVMADVGEWMQPGQPVIELVRIDKLRVEAFLNASEVAPSEIAGRTVVIEITVKDPNSNERKIEKFNSKITFVSSQIVADGSYRIATDFDNRKVGDDWAVRPGMVGNMTIKLTGGMNKTASTPVKPSTKLAPVSNK
jgi:multidrug resistance efflux pump